MQVRYFEVALRHDERPAKIADLLSYEFDVRATVTLSSGTVAVIKVEGAPNNLDDLALWHEFTE